MIEFENNNRCNYCGEKLFTVDDITIRDSKILHTECLPENLKLTTLTENRGNIKPWKIR